MNTRLRDLKGWKSALDELPDSPQSIPAFFFAHGSPMLTAPHPNNMIDSTLGSKSPLAEFLKFFGPALLKKYKPNGIVVFSAHWETLNERLVTDYGPTNPLYMDFYGFSSDLYEGLKFKSKGDAVLANKIVSLYKEAGLSARTTPVDEARGTDGLGKRVAGFDHGVSVPFSLMFGPEFLDVPVVQVSIDGSLSPEKNWEIGTIVSRLRDEGYLILSGGLLIHNLLEFSTFIEELAPATAIDFDKAIITAVETTDPKARKEAMINLTRHPGFRVAHPREDHFVPLYIAAGAGSEGNTKTISTLYGMETFAFGI